MLLKYSRHRQREHLDGKALTLTPTCGPEEGCFGQVNGEIMEDQLRLPANLLGLDLGRMFLNRIE